MDEQQSLSTRVTTHKLYYFEGKDLMKTIALTEEEAQKASKQWQAWRPVPIPNKRDPLFSDILLSPSKIEKIERYRRIDENR